MESALKRIITGIGKGLRDAGQSLERLGAKAQDNYLFRQKYCRHRAVMNLYDQRPAISRCAFVAPNASVIGNVDLCDDAAVW